MRIGPEAVRRSDLAAYADNERRRRARLRPGWARDIGAPEGALLAVDFLKHRQWGVTVTFHGDGTFTLHLNGGPYDLVVTFSDDNTQTIAGVSGDYLVDPDDLDQTDVAYIWAGE